MGLSNTLVGLCSKSDSAHNFAHDSSAKLMRRAPGKVRCNSCVCAHVISRVATAAAKIKAGKAEHLAREGTHHGNQRKATQLENGKGQ